ncbi:MAG: biotin transporter BioY [Thermofilaceae archaeon]
MEQGSPVGVTVFRLTVSTALAVVTGLLAQVTFRLGPAPYTMQNAGVVLSGLLLPPRWALLSQLLYLALIAMGLPLAAGLRGGVGILLGPTGGYLAAFPLAALLTAVLRELYERGCGRTLREAGRRDLVVLWLLSCAAAVPIYLLGYLVFARWVSADPRLAAWAMGSSRLFGVRDAALAIPLVSVLIFIPQDFAMDHALAVLVAWRVARSLSREYSLLTRG